MRLFGLVFFFFPSWGSIDEKSLNKYSAVGQYRGMNFKG